MTTVQFLVVLRNLMSGDSGLSGGSGHHDVSRRRDRLGDGHGGCWDRVRYGGYVSSRNDRSVERVHGGCSLDGYGRYRYGHSRCSVDVVRYGRYGHGRSDRLAVGLGDSRSKDWGGSLQRAKRGKLIGRKLRNRTEDLRGFLLPSRKSLRLGFAARLR